MKNLILAPTDFSEPARVGVRSAIDLARTLDASVEIVHVIDAASLSPLAPLEWSMQPEVAKGLHAHASERLEALRTELGEGVDVETRILERESVPHGLADYAAEVGARMIVMCTHGRKGVTRLLLGHRLGRGQRPAW